MERIRNTPEQSRFILIGVTNLIGVGLPLWSDIYWEKVPQGPELRPKPISLSYRLRTTLKHWKDRDKPQKQEQTERVEKKRDGKLT
jgi:hypothetical protein